MDTPSTEHDLAQALSTVAQQLAAEPDEQTTLAGIVGAAVSTVPGVVHGGISRVTGRQVTAQVPTAELVRVCDQAQTELDEGPCLEAIRHQRTVLVDDMAHEDRWPRFAARAVELGVGSMISFQLFVEDDDLGALNLYGATGARFGDEERIIGELFASHAAVALAGAARDRQLNEALATRDTIGQAKGLLMAREKITGNQAFTTLVRASQQTNIKLAEIATWLATEHEQPGQGQTHRPRSL
ncbi:hypothetical protein FHX42_002277 [Saccharopolyspora lacisalsi]|uniref:ANTAR domain-containing protein n=1 Tax=Halosaccharopolyspora lacisalsi TaxID=1000566 RepID=A0A839DVJ6_9PSEU|nr:GAF and ANTAR domain-containing protein [Halosaccharopolyspora lacisalsi]MBA8824930.1 hypothetical protein [Halosaccharopolyspora lacisalsi]